MSTNGPAQDLPAWLAQHEEYEPTRDRDGFLAKSFLQVSGLLAQLRFDDGREGRLSPSAVVKLLFCLACIMMVSLSRNFVFVLALLAGVLVVACLLPVAALRRLAGVAGGAAALTLLVMLPAVFMGQPHAPLLLGTKVLVSVGITMEMALTTPVGSLTSALRRLHVPSIAILTAELALRSLVELGTVAQEGLVALRLRSVGTNDGKASSLAGVAGITLVKAAQSSAQTYDAMRCRGFTGTYDLAPQRLWRPVDAAWLMLLALVVVLFAYLQQAI